MSGHDEDREWDRARNIEARGGSTRTETYKQIGWMQKRKGEPGWGEFSTMPLTQADRDAGFMEAPCYIKGVRL